jgi:mannose-1-phosphate guanylyltransferase
VVATDAAEVKKLVAIRGLNDFIVVDTKDALLICPKSEEQWIKKLVTEMKTRKTR